MASEISEITLIGGPGNQNIREGEKELFFSIKTGISVQVLHVSFTKVQAIDKDVSTKDISDCKEWVFEGNLCIDNGTMLIKFEEIIWNSHLRKGVLKISTDFVEQHSCDHLLYKNSKYCHVCGSQRGED
ncbi:MAG: hypothetical protein ABID67_00760 [Candidatus Nealsonbacteria bacterium]